MLISFSLHWGGLVNFSSDKFSVLPVLLSGTFLTEQVGLSDGVSQAKLDNFKWPVLKLIILSSPSSLCWASVPVWVSVAVMENWPKKPGWGKCFLGVKFTVHHQEKTGQDSKQELEGLDLSRGHRECCFLPYSSCFLIQPMLPIQGWHHSPINHSLGNHPNRFTHRSVWWRQFNWWGSYAPGDCSLAQGDKSYCPVFTGECLHSVIIFQVPNISIHSLLFYWYFPFDSWIPCTRTLNTCKVFIFSNLAGDSYTSVSLASICRDVVCTSDWGLFLSLPWNFVLGSAPWRKQPPSLCLDRKPSDREWLSGSQARNPEGLSDLLCGFLPCELVCADSSLRSAQLFRRLHLFTPVGVWHPHWRCFEMGEPPHFLLMLSLASPLWERVRPC